MTSDENSYFYENYFHEVESITGLAIPVGEDMHAHFVYGRTSCNDVHILYMYHHF
ncbi:YmaF family protein [Clostridium sp. UBA5119]|uniref:YmaF family protein n=1 Tax=Clostridium sp. UBA5119 TaxID=1946366 RepID=UPI0039C85C79